MKNVSALREEERKLSVLPERSVERPTMVRRGIQEEIQPMSSELGRRSALGGGRTRQELEMNNCGLEEELRQTKAQLAEVEECLKIESLNFEEAKRQVLILRSMRGEEAEDLYERYERSEALENDKREEKQKNDQRQEK